MAERTVISTSPSSVEERVLATIKEELTAPGYFDEFKKEVRRLIELKQRAKVTDGDQDRKRLAKLTAEVENLVAAVRQSGLSKSLQSALEQAEAEKEALSQALAVDNRQLDRIVTMVPRMTETFQRLVREFETMPRHHVDKGRHWLPQVLVGIRMIPHGPKGLIAEIEINEAGLLKLATGHSTIDLVAGVGFEPTTFGL